MTIDQAIEILNITENLDTLSEKELKSKVKAAKFRWHPDKAPSQDKITQDRYKEMFQSIEEAADCIRQYQKYGYFSSQRNEENDNPRAQQREAENRKDINSWKSVILKHWERIKQSKWRMSSRETILSDGFLIKDALKQEIKDKTPAFGFIALFAGFYIYFVVNFLALFFPLIAFVALPLFIIYSLLCIIFALPLARVWMPTWLSNIVYYCIELGLGMYDFMQKTGRLGWLMRYPYYFSVGVMILFISPIYHLVGSYFKDRSIGIQKKTVSYFGEYELNYVEDLLKKDATEYSRYELEDMFKIYNITLSFN